MSTGGAWSDMLEAEAKQMQTALAIEIDTARRTTIWAGEHNYPSTRDALRHISATLDAVRTRLVQDGPSYLPTAQAYLDTSHRIIDNIRLRLGLPE